MYKSGVSYRKIQKFVFNMTGMYLSAYNIGKLTNEKSIKTFNSQTNDLVQFMDTIGRSFIFQNENMDQITRIAIFTITDSEISNLQKYGEVIQLDATSINLENKWYLIPITILDVNRNIMSGGMIFSAFITEEIIVWILKTLIEDL